LAKNQGDFTGYVWAKDIPPWIESTILEESLREQNEATDLYRIMLFFVIEAPWSKPPKSPHSAIIESKWNTEIWSDGNLEKQLLSSSTDVIKLSSARTYGEMSKILEENGLQDSNYASNKNEFLSVERLTLLDKGKKTEIFFGILRHIRNSLAHGRFTIIDHGNERMFILEDVCTDSKRRNKDTGQYPVSARMVVRSSTLLRWVKILSKEVCTTETEASSFIE
jgi:hypothetical protein